MSSYEWQAMLRRNVRPFARDEVCHRLLLFRNVPEGGGEYLNAAGQYIHVDEGVFLPDDAGLGLSEGMWKAIVGIIRPEVNREEIVRLEAQLEKADQRVDFILDRFLKRVLE